MIFDNVFICRTCRDTMAYGDLRELSIDDLHRCKAFAVKHGICQKVNEAIAPDEREAEYLATLMQWEPGRPYS